MFFTSHRVLPIFTNFFEKNLFFIRLELTITYVIKEGFSAVFFLMKNSRIIKVTTDKMPIYRSKVRYAQI